MKRTAITRRFADFMHFGEFPFELSAVISKCDFVISDTYVRLWNNHNSTSYLKSMLQRYDFFVIIMQDVFEILNYLQNNPKSLIVAKWQSGIVAN